ncbi:hypothetical protein R1flu_019658 [Riccia fluitans]|uniref:Uncharacterized protein n=1 Tax=Riccia fluitans TaxID=41844 RepID=A0ABD1ZKQ2_9MARC
MEEPPRKRYPSDSREYHKKRKLGGVRSVRVPDEFADSYERLRQALSLKHHTDVMKWLFEGMQSQIEMVRSQQSAKEQPLAGQTDTVDSNREYDTPLDHTKPLASVEENEPEEEETEPVEENEPEEDETEPVKENKSVSEVDGISEEDMDPGPPPGYTPTYGMLSFSKIFEFFKVFPTQCPTEGCGLLIGAPVVKNMQQLWTLKFTCPRRHSHQITTGEMDTRKGTPETSPLDCMAIVDGILQEVIHDDNAAIDALLARQGIDSQKDLWHVAKNLMRKFKEDLQEK